MLAHEWLREGRIEDSLAELQALVRKEPANAQHRIFLFQLLAVLERWDRALTQLEAVGQLEPTATAMVGTYREAIAAEKERAAVFGGEARPALIGEPQEWMAWLVEALRLNCAGDHAEAAELRAKAFDAAAAIGGTIDGKPFAWIADADARLGPMLEVVVRGHYAWLPFQRVRAIRIEPPADLRDLVWMPAFITLETGAEVPALVPARYPGYEAREDALRLCRRTEWKELGDGTGCWVGAGQRILATDDDEHALMDVRTVQLEGVESARDGGTPRAGGDERRG
jgi:type VI secretion system protein ImpE